MTNNDLRLTFDIKAVFQIQDNQIQDILQTLKRAIKYAQWVDSSLQ